MPMKKTRVIVAAAGLAALCAALLLPGCTKSPAADRPGAGAAAVDPRIPTKAQPKLATIKLWLGKEEMITEMCVTEAQRETGMMFRTNMAENEGMIFVLDYPQQASFWMMNTILPLSAAYIDEDGKILEIHDFKPHDTNSVRAATSNIRFVLETPQGWFQRHNITTGAVITSEKGTLRKTFLEK
jgi:uncharacterized membrane protein (UPF0127 family)